VRVAEERGRILQVGHLERFNPAIRALSDLLTRPRFLECHRLAPFVERGTDVDVVLDLMIHDLDVILSMMKSPVAAIEAVGVPVITTSPDIANARIRFADGAIANVTASRVSLKRERKLRIFQHDTYISLDYGEKRMRICHRGHAPPGGLASIEVEERIVDGEDALAEEIRAFLDAVRTRQPPLVSGREGLRAVELAYQILEHVENELRRS
jgi:predicted dehydrogenase